jgi:hypothetical protein
MSASGERRGEVGARGAEGTNVPRVERKKATGRRRDGRAPFSLSVASGSVPRRSTGPGRGGSAPVSVCISPLTIVLKSP